MGTSTKTRKRQGGAAAVSGGHLGPVLHATLLAGARDRRNVVLDPGDCGDLVAQARKVSGLTAALRRVEALVQATTKALGEEGAVPAPVLQGLALQVHSLVQAGLSSK